MTDREVSHTVEFYDKQDYDPDAYPEPLHSASAESVPVPQEGDEVEFGWYERDGERVDHMDVGDDETEYARSGMYTVESVSHYYANARVAGQDGWMVTNHVEVATTVIVEEAQ